MFDPVDPKQNFPKLEEKILKYWKENKIFEKSVKSRPKDDEYVFYDGPPFATGLPHYGHILAGTMKDVVPRYWTMRGKRVERRFGWDCHGLPVEYEVEKELGLKGRQDIVEKYGVYEFSEKCRSVVMRYATEWRETVERMGRWIDMDDDYKTMDPGYMESIWWVFRQLWDKGLVYKGSKNMLVCPRCTTPLSNFEASLNYKDVDDHGISVKMFLTEKSAKKIHPKTKKPIAMIPWTTTPWTLPGNMGMYVGPDIAYAIIEEEKECYVIAEKAVPKYYKNEDPKIVKRLKGSEFIGLDYEPLFPYHPPEEYKDEYPNVYTIIGEDIVSEDEGTGVVHSAVTYGDEQDFDIAQRNNMPFVHPVQMDGTYAPYMTEFAGKYWKDAEDDVAKALKKRGLVIKYETYRHSYPHCWRCESPLMYNTLGEWFVSIGKIKKTMMAANKKTNWMPAHLRDGRFGNWLENARDWCISRNRFWGTPLPIWESEDGDFICVGSIEELEKLSGKKVKDIHKHLIDDITFEKDGKTYKRIPEVLDCWFESGSMPYAQMHYPFENKKRFEGNFPAEYIAEGLDQTRGWFYTLVVLGSALFEKAPFKNVVVNGMILAEDGKKMSKRLKNYPEPGLIFEKYGADALRFYLMNSPVVKAEPLCFSERGVENVVKNVILPIWNAYSFFVMYANIDKFEPGKAKKPKNKLDRWILSELHALIKEVTEEMDAYNLQAIRPIYHFIEQLTNWYIRRSRRRFWKSEDDQDKAEGYQTLYTVLTTLCQVMAPIMPLISEDMYRNLTKAESVHLSDWPTFDKSMINTELNQEIEMIMLIAKLGNAARSRAKIKTRQPLQKVQIGVPESMRHLIHEDQLEVLREELNVKEIDIAEDPSHIAKTVVRPDPKLLGPKFGKDVQFIIKEAKSGNFELLEDGGIKVGQFELTPEEFNVGYESQEGLDVESDHGIVVALETTITPELKREGMARDIIRTIQDMRKEADYNVDDRIKVAITAEGEAKEAVEVFKDLIANETLAKSVETSLDKPDLKKAANLDGEKLQLAIKR